MNKNVNETPTDKAGEHKEQINAILDNLNNEELQEIYKCALNSILQGRNK